MKTVTFKRYHRWYYNANSTNSRHKNCSKDGYMLRIVAIWKGRRRKT